MSNNKVNCLNIAYIFKTSVGSINGSWTEGNVSTVKKITLPDGKQLPYVSGQSLKYQIRRGWVELGYGNQLSEVVQTSNTKGVNFTQGDPAQYLDDDLLGFMIASEGENRRRTAPVRVSAAIGIFPYRGDRDLGTKSKEQAGGDMGAGGNIYETEIYYNYFRVNFLIEIDRIGNFQPSELHKDKKNVTTNELTKRRERLKQFFESLENVWGGGKQSRILTDMSPKFLAITFQTSKSPIFLETLTLSDQEELNVGAVNEVLNGNTGIIAKKFIGVQSGIFKNNVVAAVKDTTSIQDAWKAAKIHIENLVF
ncbi:MAG: type I-B CRISPR-associated protein Cas7/Cst2/DevR [Saprospiraceae bacterium]|nr:type I-B CRISPR-associated protein Cas7/Cst2/DevR [Saprospiraceae bacterium]MCF8252464.1 type I-B CRISPR-associated protein Cas7/Cst2/DevR [Saprospiraceae bacterium]MCF8282331.1 type I-B CRISPR-associated protein Cas7/Cst2/DevR [Bacteroidales bacterium]MCF8314049.1 type I-B CRISPR-associated protein Cas7/Cst2/DevR [Saprospiraceae bacterium]MCF8442787.1 type I-B CRISPR-associated protein Cas7/Cst2/DevR [Saprospiraceae bacterium]